MTPTTSHDDLLERRSVKVVEERTERGKVIRTLVLLGKDGERVGGIAFAPTDPLYDLPLWIERLSDATSRAEKAEAELSRLRKIEQAADGLAKAAGRYEDQHASIGTDLGCKVCKRLMDALSAYQAAKEGRS